VRRVLQRTRQRNVPALNLPNGFLFDGLDLLKLMR
jgi:hypothetical protein